MKLSRQLIAALATCLCLLIAHRAAAQQVQFETQLEDLAQPWGMDFAPTDPGFALITEKQGGVMAVLWEDATVRPISLGMVPGAVEHGQGGLMDVLFHPQWPQNPHAYFTYTAQSGGNYVSTLARAPVTRDGAVVTMGAVEVLLTTRSAAGGTRHFGSRLAWDDQGYLYMSVGDRGDRDRAQDLTDHAGKVLRLDELGQAAADNPFVNDSAARPEIFTLGHRNPQGMLWDAASQSIWVHEHGPRGGDEINRLRAGQNYGWPEVSHGREYWGPRISDHKSLPGYIDPEYVWVPSIAPSGFAVYPNRADAPFELWQGAFLVGALKAQALVLVPRDAAQQPLDPAREQRILTRENERFRDVHVTPSGEVYVLTDGSPGKLARLTP